MTTINRSRILKGWIPPAIICSCVVAISVIGGLATNTSSVWYMTLNKPSWQPPSWLFGPVWSTIYLLFALSAIIVWNKSEGEQRTKSMNLYAVNGVMNLSWSFVFFRAESPLWAGILIIAIWATIIMMIVQARPISRAASLMLLPYVLWVSFASVLNWTIVMINS